MRHYVIEERKKIKAYRGRRMLHMLRTLHPRWSNPQEQQKIERDEGLHIEEECRKSATNSRKLNEW